MKLFRALLLYVFCASAYAADCTTITYEGFCWPTGSASFGVGGHFLEHGSDRGGGYSSGRYHIGLDMGVPVGTDIVAISDGVVHSFSYNGWETGNIAVLVKHKRDDDTEYVALYGHIRSIPSAIKIGKEVKAGDTLGYVGPHSGGPHLHFSIWPNTALPTSNYGLAFYAPISGSPNHPYPNTFGQVDPVLFMLHNKPKKYASGDYITNLYFFKNVYRFWGDGRKAHFFSGNDSEASHIRQNDNSWSYEGLAYRIPDSSIPESVPLFRFWSPNFNKHFFTVSETERDDLIANDPNWKYEGVAYHVYHPDFVDPNVIPVYRFWSDTYSGHFYTASQPEKEHLEANDPNWRYEGIAFKAIKD